VQQSRLLASVALIEALGGGWSNAALPDRSKVMESQPWLP